MSTLESGPSYTPAPTWTSWATRERARTRMRGYPAVWVTRPTYPSVCGALRPHLHRRQRPRIRSPAGQCVSGLYSYRQQGEELLALVGTEFHVAVTNGGPNTAVVSTGADGQVSFDVTVTAGHATASIEITEIARSDYPFLGASCGHDNLPLLDWTDRPHLTLELEPGWNAGCWFYHAPPGASPRPTSAPTLPPTDTDAVVAAGGSPALPVVLLLLAISAALPLRRLRHHRAAAADIES